MKKLFVIFSVCAVLFVSGCGTKTTLTQTPDASTPSNSNPQTNNGSQTDSMKTSFNVDWDKCFQDTKASITGSSYSYVHDVSIKVDDSAKKITFTAALDDSVAPKVALDYADTLLRQFNTFASKQDSSISGGTKSSYGGLYDTYQAAIGISPLSKTQDTSKWFVYDTVPAKAQTSHEIKLQPAYR